MRFAPAFRSSAALLLLLLPACGGQVDFNDAVATENPESEERTPLDEDMMVTQDLLLPDMPDPPSTDPPEQDSRPIDPPDDLCPWAEVETPLELQSALDDPDCPVVRLAAGTIQVEAPVIVSRNVIIQGTSEDANESVLSALNKTRVLNLNADIKVTLERLALVGGEDGEGGLLFSEAHLTLNDVVLTSGVAERGGALAQYGGTLALTGETLIVGNRVTELPNHGFSGQEAPIVRGGGLYLAGVDVQIGGDVTIANNRVAIEAGTGEGAGLYAVNSNTVLDKGSQITGESDAHRSGREESLPERWWIRL